MSRKSEMLAPPLEAFEVTPVPCDGQLSGRGVESPRAHTAYDGYVLSISGWVHAAPVAPSWVHVVSQERAVASAAVAFPRPDVAAHLSLSAEEPLGFLTEINVLGLPRSFELTLEVEFADGRRFPFAAITGARQPLHRRFQPTMRPIFVTNIGRCGSTLLMSLLGGHPRVAVHDLHPYETRALGYWAHMLKVLGEPANHARSASPNSYEDDAFWVGRHPHNMHPVIEPDSVHRFLRRDYVECLAEFAQASTEGFYRSVSEAQGVEEPAYFAEKRNPRATARIASELYPEAREIFLVRDPRDMVCSMISFYEKTQLVSFGRDRSGSDEAFVADIARALRDLIRQMHERGEDAIVVRYEDLIHDMPGTLTTVLEYLDLARTPAIVEAILTRARQSTPESRRHRTTPDDRASVHRWRRDLSESMQRLCGGAFAESLNELGYEL
jgi:sulfotransferase family protein